MAEKEGLHQRLKQAIVWLKQNKNILQLDIAEKMNMTTVGFSRGLARCKEKNDEAFVIKFHQATDEIFSLDWLLYGTGDKFTADIKKAEQPPATPAPTSVDASSAINAAIAAYVELTNRLKQEMADRLADKDTIIAEKQARIVALEQTVADKDAIIKSRDNKILYLESKLAASQVDDIENYPFAIGAAETNSLRNNI
jgi:DNA-binding transcriptional regulator LsrR (DeoR family)